MADNPFTPTFGEVPAYLAGRDAITRALTRAFESEHRRPELATIFSGARGTGKTVLLCALASLAQKRGWVTVNVTSLPGMLDDIEIQTRRCAEHLLGSAGGTTVRSVGIPQVVEVQLAHPEATSNWRSRMTALIEELNASGTGLLITVDEVDAGLDEMIQLAAVYQHFVREGLKVSLLMAGLPHHISSLLNDKTASFLRRANYEHLGRIPDFEVRRALQKTIEQGGRSVDEEGIAQAVSAVDGFAFLLQLVGYYAWDASPDNALVSTGDFEQGIALARDALEGRVLEATYRELSTGDILFLEAMLQDEGDSNISDIAARLGKSPSLTGQHRARLAAAGVIGQRRRGVVGFDLPFFREYLESRTGR